MAWLELKALSEKMDCLAHLVPQVETVRMERVF
jgi:hypothetical protein